MYKVDKVYVQPKGGKLVPAPQEVIQMMEQAQQEGRTLPPPKEIGQVEPGDIVLETSGGTKLIKPEQFGSTHADILAIIGQYLN